MVKNLPANATDVGLIPGWERSPGEGNGQYSCLGNPMDRGAWWATLLDVTEELDTIYRLNNNNNDVRNFVCEFSIYMPSLVKFPFKNWPI